MIAASTWPDAYDPARSPVFTHNELQTARNAQQLWPTLIRAAAWPRWYSNACRVVLPAGHSELAPGLTFSWTTFGVRVTSTVREFVPGRRLAWDGKALGSTGYHRWELHPTADAGCLIVTEEVQRGSAPRLVAPLMRRGARWSVRACALQPVRRHLALLLQVMSRLHAAAGDLDTAVATLDEAISVAAGVADTVGDRRAHRPSVGCRQVGQPHAVHVGTAVTAGFP